MAVTPTSLKAKHLEFDDSELTDAAIQSHIDDAAFFVSADVWGDAYDTGIDWKACHLLALSPFGRAMQLVADDETTVYSKQFDTLAIAMACGVGRVT